MNTALDQDSSWKHILALSNSMQQGAANEDWQLVASVAVERHQSVNQHFERFPVGPETAEYYVPRLNDFLLNEQSLQQLAKQARKNIMRLGADMQQGKKAQQAYRSSDKHQF